MANAVSHINAATPENPLTMKGKEGPHAEP